ncbi:MAG: polysaccharide deacetylase family protein [Algibacter sp.]|nr:polysaccharide deacetylase family protein [Algibacter sp.]MDG1730527.1 polysaccharide deacetylase family protein [Algibacter sp.]MDG2177588.1 polysaccharide deacetylase family protein [Algibacter sp.]
MTFTPIKTPLVAKKLFPNYIWDVSTSEKVIYLTFDDGPTPEITHWTLDVLKTYNAKATFFCIGNNIEKHPEIFQNILNAGHAIGNHTQNHIKGWKTKAKDYLKNIELCETILKSQITDSSIVNSNALITNLFRPPYGQITPKQGNELMALGYKIVMWDVLSFDWEESIEKENCLNNVITKTIAGSIIVFHDSIKASRNMQYALPQVLKHFSEKGYCFKALNTAV